MFDLDEVFGKEGAKIKMHEIIHLQDQRIEELEEQLKYAIIPKFKIGQEVWFIYDENDDFNYTILNKKVMAYNYFSYEGGYFEYAMSDDGTRDTIWYGYIDERFVFATKEEAELEKKRWKLKNM